MGTRMTGLVARNGPRGQAQTAAPWNDLSAEERVCVLVLAEGDAAGTAYDAGLRERHFANPRLGAFYDALGEACLAADGSGDDEAISKVIGQHLDVAGRLDGLVDLKPKIASTEEKRARVEHLAQTIIEVHASGGPSVN